MVSYKYLSFREGRCFHCDIFYFLETYFEMKYGTNDGITWYMVCQLCHNFCHFRKN